jgi:hypothetical protein
MAQCLLLPQHDHAEAAEHRIGGALNDHIALPQSPEPRCQQMNFRPKNFRRLSGDSKPEFKIREANRNPLVLIKESGEAMYASTRADKDALIAEFNAETDLLLWAWVGQWRTDVFQLSDGDVKNYYK